MNDLEIRVKKATGSVVLKGYEVFVQGVCNLRIVDSRSCRFTLGRADAQGALRSRQMPAGQGDDPASRAVLFAASCG
ncbi:hypothetical protein COMA1_10569 [Candidatus Nitrospira nitrosa]|uniref:Uncharacterized protein n=1 Tax=Candidatus Nitrospira nitrosa TaxID=1742972 RepID=A0A0S4LB25_9BACT|nr:hypothetical protein COMA1_10569 [Candidatus Nitrospira nitrosa]